MGSLVQNSQNENVVQTQILAQLVTNPRNKQTTPVYEIEPEKSVDLNAMDCKDVQTRSGKLINSPPVIITKSTLF